MESVFHNRAMTCISSYNFKRNLVLGGLLNLFESQFLSQLIDHLLVPGRPRGRLRGSSQGENKSRNAILGNYYWTTYGVTYLYFSFIDETLMYTKWSSPCSERIIRAQFLNILNRPTVGHQPLGSIRLTSYLNTPRIHFFEQYIRFDFKSTRQ